MEHYAISADRDIQTISLAPLISSGSGGSCSEQDCIGMQLMTKNNETVPVTNRLNEELPAVSFQIHNNDITCSDYDDGLLVSTFDRTSCDVNLETGFADGWDGKVSPSPNSLPDDMSLSICYSDDDDDGEMTIIDIEALDAFLPPLPRIVETRDVGVSPAYSDDENEGIEVVDVSELFREDKRMSRVLHTTKSLGAMDSTEFEQVKLTVKQKPDVYSLLVHVSTRGPFCLHVIRGAMHEISLEETGMLITGLESTSLYYKSLKGIVSTGDELLEWNGQCLRGKGNEQVKKLIDNTTGEVELTIRRREAYINQKKKPYPFEYTRKSLICDDSATGIEQTPAGNDGNISLVPTGQGKSGDRLGDDSGIITGPVIRRKPMVTDLLKASSETTSGDEKSSRGMPLYAIRESAQFMAAQLLLTTSSFSEAKSTPGKVQRVRSRSSCKMTTMKEEELNMVQRIRRGRINTKLIKGKQMYRGLIELAISHDTENEQLKIGIMRGRDLLPQDANGYSDPYVKVYMLPGRNRENKRKTKYIPKTLNPDWHETVVFENLHPDELQYKTLEITVWDYDRLTMNDFMGKVVLELSDKSLIDGKARWYQLMDLQSEAANTQQSNVSDLNYGLAMNVVTTDSPFDRSQTG